MPVTSGPEPRISQEQGRRQSAHSAWPRCAFAPFPSAAPCEGLSNNSIVTGWAGGQEGTGGQRENNSGPLPASFHSPPPTCLKETSVSRLAGGEERKGGGLAAAHPARFEAGTTQALAPQAVSQHARLIHQCLGPLGISCQIHPSAHPKVGSHPCIQATQPPSQCQRPLFWVPIPYYHTGPAITPFGAIFGKTLPVSSAI